MILLQQLNNHVITESDGANRINSIDELQGRRKSLRR